MYYVTTFARQRLQSNLASSYGKSWGKLVIIVFQAHHVIQLVWETEKSTNPSSMT